MAPLKKETDLSDPDGQGFLGSTPSASGMRRIGNTPGTTEGKFSVQAHHGEPAQQAIHPGQDDHTEHIPLPGLEGQPLRGQQFDQMMADMQSSHQQREAE